MQNIIVYKDSSPGLLPDTRASLQATQVHSPGQNGRNIISLIEEAEPPAPHTASTGVHHPDDEQLQFISLSGIPLVCEEDCFAFGSRSTSLPSRSTSFRSRVSVERPTPDIIDIEDDSDYSPSQITSSRHSDSTAFNGGNGVRYAEYAAAGPSSYPAIGLDEYKASSRHDRDSTSVGFEFLEYVRSESCDSSLPRQPFNMADAMSDADFNKLYPLAKPSSVRPNANSRKTLAPEKRKPARSKKPDPAPQDFEVEEIEHKGRKLRPAAPKQTTVVELKNGHFIRIVSICQRYTYGIRDSSEIYDGIPEDLIDAPATDEPLAVQIVLKGLKFQRTRTCSGYLPLRKNEVALVSEDAEVLLQDVTRIRQLIMTCSEISFRGADGRIHSDNPALENQRPDDETAGRLYCRWRVFLPRNKIHGMSSQEIFTHPEGYIRRLFPHECDPAYRIEDSVRRERWRYSGEFSDDVHASVKEEVLSTSGTPIASAPKRLCSVGDQAAKKIKFGYAGTAKMPNSEGYRTSDSPERSSSTVIDLTEASTTRTAREVLPVFKNLSIDPIPRVSRPRSPRAAVTSESSCKAKYTFGDAFCGAGGMASGARSAGFNVAWSFDFNRPAWESFRANFPECESYHCSVDEFCAISKSEKDGKYVDVLHLSPPCQPHSPAHTINGKDDEMNEASMLCIMDVLTAIKPRVVTLEQTFGILRRAEWFRALINQFTRCGYSVRWKLLRCIEFGVPQNRVRLFVLASCPGEMLPSFPNPIHAAPERRYQGETWHRKPPRTVRDAIGPIQYRPDLNYNEPSPFPSGEKRLAAARWDEPFNRTLTASGGEYNVHPDGYRPFTTRELACLQTFPIDHKFVGTKTQVEKQIGNAVPPMMATSLLKEVRKSLEKTDRGDVQEQSGTPIMIVNETEEEDLTSIIDLSGDPNDDCVGTLERDEGQQVARGSKVKDVIVVY